MDYEHSVTNTAKKNSPGLERYEWTRTAILGHQSSLHEAESEQIGIEWGNRLYQYLVKWVTARNSRSRGLGLGAGKMLSLSCKDQGPAWSEQGGHDGRWDREVTGGRGHPGLITSRDGTRTHSQGLSRSHTVIIPQRLTVCGSKENEPFSKFFSHYHFF